MILGGKNAGLALFVNIEEMSISDSYVVKENDLRGMAGRSDGMRYRRNRQGGRYAMTGRQRLMYRLCLLGVLIAVVAFTAVYWYFGMRSRIPDEITLFQDRVENIDFGIPFTQVRVSQTDAEAARVSIDHAKKADGHIRFSMAGPLSVTAQNCGSLQGEVRLFGWLPCKKIRIDIRKGTKVMPAGRAVGLYIHADGVMVLGTGRIAAAGGEEQTPAYNKLQTGDYIYAVNGRKVVTIRDVSRLVQKNGAKQMILSVKRDSGRIQVKLTPVRAADGSYQIGVWLREDTEGIGTLTFVTPENQFAALGHGITDADTDLLIRLQNGGLYPAGIDHVVKGKNGTPGQLAGYVQLGKENRLGEIENNTLLGITGQITNRAYQYQEDKACEAACKQDVRKGKAVIRCQLDDQVKEYEVEIEKINLSSQDNKGMEIHVTDQELLEKAGGIVQGMSGAPILQNGKCIGAVTHVFVRDVTRGYATFLENML